MNSDIEKLLVLQERDKNLFEIESSLANIPLKKAAIEEKIKAEKDAVAQAENELKKTEVEQAALRVERRSKEEKAESMNEQRQSLMKKPVEYQTLERAIENLKKEAGNIEEKEIELLYKIDELKENLDKEKTERQKTIDLFNNELKRLDEEKVSLEARLDESRFKVREAEQSVSAPFLEAYNILKKRSKRRPFLAQIEDGKCCGCHLKLSSELVENAKKDPNPVNCEMCGRLVYFE